MTPRDNVLYELGLFTGALGSNSTFVLLPSGSEVKVPTDLGGVIVHPYTPVEEDAEFTDLRAAVRGTCNALVGRMARELVRRQAHAADAAAHPPQAEAPIAGAELLAVQVFADLQRGSLPALSSESDIVGRVVVHVAHGIGQVVASGSPGEDQLAVVRFVGGVMSTPVSELRLSN
jgi:hypothetical protein